MIPADVRATCLSLIDLSALNLDAEDCQTHLEIIQEILEGSSSADELPTSITTVFSDVHPQETIDLIIKIVKDALNKALIQHTAQPTVSKINKDLLLKRMSDFNKPSAKPVSHIPPSVEDGQIAFKKADPPAPALAPAPARKPVTIVKADGQVINPQSVPPPPSLSHTGRERNRDYGTGLRNIPPPPPPIFNGPDRHCTDPLPADTNALLHLFQQQQAQQQAQQQVQQQQAFLQAILSTAPNQSQSISHVPTEPETLVLQPSHHGLTWNVYCKNIPVNLTITPLINFFTPFGGLVALRLFPFDPSRQKQNQHDRPPSTTAVAYFSSEANAAACLHSGRFINNNPAISMSWAKNSPTMFSNHSTDQPLPPPFPNSAQSHQPSQQPQHPPRAKNPYAQRLHALNHKERKLPDPRSDEFYQSTELSLKNAIARVESFKKLKLTTMQELVAKKKALKEDAANEALQKQSSELEQKLKVINDQLPKVEKQRDEFQQVLNDENKNRETREWCKKERQEIHQLMAQHVSEGPSADQADVPQDENVPAESTSPAKHSAAEPIEHAPVA